LSGADIGTSKKVATDIYVVDSNGNQQQVKSPGFSGADEPAWTRTVNQTTPDNTISWLNTGAASAPNVASWKYLYVFNSTLGDTGETYYHISAGSPVSSAIIQDASSNIALSGDCSSDTQVNFVHIYRTKQGGSVYYYLDSVANDTTAGAQWSYVDGTPDEALDTSLVVSTVPLNSPPPAGASLVAYFQSRIWVAVDNKLYFDGGSDILNGDPHQCFPAANQFIYPTTIRALIPTSEGLNVMLEDESWTVLGGPQTLTFYTIPLFKTTGAKSQNCVLQDQDVVYMLTSQGQGIVYNSSDFGEFGSNVADVLKTSFNPSSSYLAAYRNGSDVGIFLSDGSSKIFRFNPVTSAWSPIATIAAGCGPLAALETASSTYTLLTTIGTRICGRSLTDFRDGSAQDTYAANAVIGSLDVAGMAGPTVAVRYAYLRTTSAGLRPTVSILQNETSGTFNAIGRTVSVPAKLDSTSYQSSTVRQDRYDFATAYTPLPMAEFNHLQIKIEWTGANAKNEVTALSLGGDAQ
jgi:hypothetical protein